MSKTECRANDTSPQLLTTRQAAERLAVSLRTLERLAAIGELPAVRFGRSVRIDSADLAAFIESRKRPSLDFYGQRSEAAARER